MQKQLVPPVYSYALPALCSSKGCINDPAIGYDWCQSCLDKARSKVKPKSERSLPKGVSYIYFVQAGEDGLIKIGRTKDVQARMCSLNSASPVELKLLGVFKAKDYMEKILHEEFAKYRVKGEWFKPVEEIKNFILAYKFKGNN
ncbi:GIY-YIG nuclease family protein [Spartinivicinus ruber]|uniref:GIY-YIG nuclease family protein n=1 Tax=Spartinivicinus ruber TaxID=2683272 RepID=UPI0013D3E123|nr:GIY-YIG nuclease family protein [Spartinivicinus ruber]